MTADLGRQAVVGPEGLLAARAVTERGPGLIIRLQLDCVLELLARARAGEVESHGGEWSPDRVRY